MWTIGLRCPTEMPGVVHPWRTVVDSPTRQPITHGGRWHFCCPPPAIAVSSRSSRGVHGLAELCAALSSGTTYTWSSDEVDKPPDAGRFQRRPTATVVGQADHKPGRSGCCRRLSGTNRTLPWVILHSSPLRSGPASPSTPETLRAATNRPSGCRDQRHSDGQRWAGPISRPEGGKLGR